MGLDRVTALMEPRVTSLLATFLWMAEDDENKSVSDSKTPPDQTRMSGQRD